MVLGLGGWGGWGWRPQSSHMWGRALTCLKPKPGGDAHGGSLGPGGGADPGAAWDQTGVRAFRDGRHWPRLHPHLGGPPGRLKRQGQEFRCDSVD